VTHTCTLRKLMVAPVALRSRIEAYTRGALNRRALLDTMMVDRDIKAAATVAIDPADALGFDRWVLANY
jgi:hypothetical protein